jgi:hypothetical protein
MGVRSIIEREGFPMRDLRVRFPEPCDEKWEAMTPAGCAGVCGRCDKSVHDLSHYTLDEAAALLRRGTNVCVRARIDGNGLVALKPSRRGCARRMVIAFTATAGLLAASAPAAAKQNRPDGAIAGNVETFGFRVRVSATDAGGQTFRARVKSNGQFRISHLPAGTYTLTFHPDCGDSWKVDNVVVRVGETIVPNVENANRCIVIGMLQIEDDRG